MVKRFFKFSHSIPCVVKLIMSLIVLAEDFVERKVVATVGHFTAVCSVIWPLNGSDAGGDLALIQTSLLNHVNAKQ